MKAVLVGMGAGLGLTALGLDTSVSLSPYGLYLGADGPLLVIAGVPAFLNVVFAVVLIRGDRVMKYSMIATGIIASVVLGFLAFQGVFQDLLGGH
jgi:hypothetical protein